jgi:hypothetical protein
MRVERRRVGLITRRSPVSANAETGATRVAFPLPDKPPTVLCESFELFRGAECHLNAHSLTPIHSRLDLFGVPTAPKGTFLYSSLLQLGRQCVVPRQDRRFVLVTT